MSKTKVLFISQEITPYLPETEIANVGRKLPQGIQEKGKEIRTFMPKYGCINERRNQLHEVIRLSGMNLIIDDTDHPLIIKVASIQQARMQIYFIDNEDYFGRKSLFMDDNGIEYDDNDERMIFFVRGVLETVKKLRWSPDIIHCHGWITSLAPLYIKKAYKDDPLFSEAKIVYSLYDNEFKKELSENFKNKAKMEGVGKKDLEMLTTPNYVNLNKLAIQLSDALVLGSQKINPDIERYIQEIKKPTINYVDEENYIDAYSNLYDKLLNGSAK